MKKVQIRTLLRQLNRIAIVSAVATAALAGTAATADVVTNGFFTDQDSSSSGYAGYVGQSGGPSTFPDWSYTGGVGVNGYDIHYNGATQIQFRPNNYTPSATTDPRDYAFLQSTGSSISQNITANLNTLSLYTLTFVSATRSINPDATGTASVTIDGLTYSVKTLAAVPAGYDPSQDFKGYTLDFATGATLSSAVLELANTTSALVNSTSDHGNDQTVDFGDVVITYDGPVPTPEPGTYALLGLGIAGLLVASRRALKA